MALVWPVTLPAAPLVESFMETPPTLSMRTNMDAGPPKVRRRFTAGIASIACDYMLTREQTEILDDFYVVITGGGALSFEWVHPRKLPAGTVVNVRFKDAPTLKPEQSVEHWRVSINLEVLPPGMAATLDAAVAARRELAR